MYSITDLVLRLRSVRHFQHIQGEELEQIVRMGQILSFSSQSLLFQQEAPSAGLHVLLSGRVQICKLSPQGQNAILAVFDPVVMFNEVAALDRGPNPVTAMAADDSVVWRLSAENLDKLILRQPHVGLGMLRVLAMRNRHLVEQFGDVSFRTVLARTAKLLLELSDDGTRVIDRRKHPVHQLAARVSTVPEAFSRSLKAFRSNGSIRCAGSTIEVLNPAELKAIVEMGPRVISSQDCFSA
jgi:CRP/FNR family transcriptional regulator